MEIEAIIMEDQEKIIELTQEIIDIIQDQLQDLEIFHNQN